MHKISRIFRSAISLVLVVALLGTGCVFADSKSLSNEQKIEYRADCIRLINVITDKLGEQGTSVESELLSFINDLEQANEKERCSNKDMLVIGARKALTCYENSVAKERGTAQSDLEQYHIGAVGAVIAWFNSKGYKLSAELLDNALVNKTLNSWYYPYYGNRVDSSSVFISIKNNMTDSSGSGIFLKDGSVNGNDLYYGIRKFAWFKRGIGSSTVRIRDRYDYTEDYKWTSIEGIALNVMQTAESIGVLTPFYTIIER